jgi:curved DNA-binding protein
VSVKFQDYYSVLGVPRTATPEEIQRAYRKLARQKHPDVDKTPGATERFKQITEANEVLKDPKTRARYDQLGANWKEGQEFTPPPEWGDAAGRRGYARGAGRPADFDGFSSFFESLFGDRAGSAFDFHVDGEDGESDGPRRGGRGRARRGSSIEASLEITLDEALRGATKTIQLSSNDAGVEPRTIDVKIPPGTAPGTTMRLRGQGSPGTAGPGDLLLKIEIAEDPRFRAADHDLTTTVAIAPDEAALGARVAVPLAGGGEASVTVPAGSSSGKRLRLRGHGLPKRDGTRGDLFVEIAIVVPEQLSAAERAAYEALAAARRRPAP